MPIGTVVTLREGTKKVMICGRVQEDTATNKVYDYCACYYPEGILDPHELFLFNEEDVDIIYYVGMQDSEEFAFRAFLNDHEG